MFNKVNSQFLQSFLIVFLMTVFSNLVYFKVSHLYSKFYKSFSTKELTKEAAIEIKNVISEQIIEDATEPVAVFFYQNNYSSRVRFDSNTVVSNPIINDVKSDSEYSRMLNYHLEGLCYQQDFDSMNKESSLYRAFLNLESDKTYLGYYTSCPIITDDVLVGYLGTFYTLNSPTRPSIRVSRLDYLSNIISDLIDPYF